MSRFLRGRTMYDGRLSPPVRVFQPDLLDPTQQQIAVKYVTIPEQAPINRQSRRRHVDHHSGTIPRADGNYK